MRFEFTIEPAATGAILPVIPALPDIPMLWVEGRNGIGKSLAIRLLDLATGGQPYHTNVAAWRTLSQSMGRARIEATGQGVSLALTLTPESWETSPSATSPDQLGTFVCNGEPCDLDAVRATLTVVRISGEEGLPRAIAGRYAGVALELERFATRLRRPQEEADHLIEGALELMSVLDVAVITGHTSAVVAAEAELTRATSAYESAESRLTNLRLAQRRRRSLESLEDRGPDLRRREQELQDTLTAVESRRERALLSLTELAAGAAQEKELTAQLVRIERLVGRRQRAAQQVADQAIDLATQLDTATETDVVAQRLSEVTAQLDALAMRRSDLSRADSVHRLVRELLDLLNSIPDTLVPMGAQLLELNEVLVTREALEAALRSAAERLGSTQLALEVDELDRTIAGIVLERERLDELLGVLRTLDRKRDAVREAVDTLESLEAGLASSAAGSFRDARHEFDAAVAEAQRTTMELLQVRHALSVLAEGASEADLHALLTELLTSAAVAIEELDDAVVAAAGELDQTASERSHCRALYEEARQELTEANSLRIQQLHSFHSGPEWAWLRGVIGELDLAAWDAGQFVRLRSALVATRERVNRAAASVAGVARALHDIAGHLTGERSLGRLDGLGATVVSVAERDLLEEFSQVEIRNALFGGDAIEAVNLRELHVQWLQDGRPMLRPFASFSSGEQAFAYARARIAQLASRVGAAHVLLVLDEFGAFIASDRRASLYKLLKNRIDDGTVDQVIMILPLAQDYSAASRDATGESAEVYRRRSSEIESLGYFAEPVPGGE